MKKGFTLIEMLVVVLIIGILAGVALPQYTSAVRKARVAEAKIALRALADATDRYYLQNGDTAWTLEDLDVKIETDTKNWEIYEDECTCNGDKCGCTFVAEPKLENDYYIGYASPNYFNGEDLTCGKIFCFSRNNTGQKICKSLGGKVISDDNNLYEL